jgi:SAM-dependent methyltransferase
VIAALDRLRSIVIQLPLAELPPRLLEVGCGDDPGFALLPGWTGYGLDLDGAALRRARHPRLIQADARHLPGLLHTQFGMILIRHPDLFRHRAAWGEVIPRLPALLAPGGLLLITVYAPEEVEIVQALDLPPIYPLDPGSLVPCDLTGHDRFALATRTATIL